MDSSVVEEVNSNQRWMQNRTQTELVFAIPSLPPVTAQTYKTNTPTKQNRIMQKTLKHFNPNQKILLESRNYHNFFYIFE